MWGQRHLRYLKEYRRITYFNLLTDGRLNIYLSDIDKQAKEMVPQLTEQMAEREGVTEQIKSTN
ncbi:TnpV protein [Vescimonas sp.]|uniref:TnpV protein n=1 Tax=Vescimonas sp. TaxID=2892404 RepID=UPI00307C901C